MKKIISMAFIVLTVTGFAAASSSVFADTTTKMTPATSVSAKDFPARKATVLQHISDRIAKMQQIQSCVQASTDMASMHACKPQKDDKGKDK